jgi:hypothetical protein
MAPDHRWNNDDLSQLKPTSELTFFAKRQWCAIAMALSAIGSACCRPT